jgi:hypothetical protein
LAAANARRNIHKIRIPYYIKCCASKRPPSWIEPRTNSFPTRCHWPATRAKHPTERFQNQDFPTVPNFRSLSSDPSRHRAGLPKNMMPTGLNMIFRHIQPHQPTCTCILQQPMLVVSLDAKLPDAKTRVATITRPHDNTPNSNPFFTKPSQTGQTYI